MKNEHIDTIRKQLGVALTTISRYNNEHIDEINQIGSIFDLKGDNKEKVLALLYMFSADMQDKTVQKYREQAGMNSAEYDSATMLERYKVPLLAALIYNRAFYAMAKNYRGFVEAGLPVVEAKKEKPIDHQGQSNAGKNVTVFVFWRRIPQTYRRMVAAAVMVMGLGLVSFSTVTIAEGVRLGPQYDSLAAISYHEGSRISWSEAPKARGEPGNSMLNTKDCTKAIRADRNNAELYISRGISYTLDCYYKAAVRDFTKAIKLDPQNTSAYYNRAVAKIGMDFDYDSIIADLDVVLNENPDDADAHKTLEFIQKRKSESANE